MTVEVIMAYLGRLLVDQMGCAPEQVVPEAHFLLSDPWPRIGMEPADKDRMFALVAAEFGATVPMELRDGMTTVGDLAKWIEGERP